MGGACGCGQNMADTAGQNGAAAGGSPIRNRSIVSGAPRSPATAAVAPVEMFGRCLHKYLGESGGAIAMSDGERGALIMFVPTVAPSPLESGSDSSPASVSSPSSSALCFSMTYVSKRTGALFSLENINEVEMAKLRKSANMEQVGWGLFVKSVAADIIKNKVRCDVRGDGVAVMHFSIHLSKNNETTEPFTLRLPEVSPSLPGAEPSPSASPSQSPAASPSSPSASPPAASPWGTAYQRLFVEPSIRVVAHRRCSVERREKERKLDEIARTITNSPHFQRMIQERIGPHTAAVQKVRDEADAVSRAGLPDKVKVRVMERRLECAQRNTPAMMRLLDAMYEQGGVLPTRPLHLLRSVPHSPILTAPSSKIITMIRRAASIFVAKSEEKKEQLMPPPHDSSSSNSKTCVKNNSSPIWMQSVSASWSDATTNQQEDRIAVGVVKALTHVDEWAFDVFELDAASSGNALFCIALALMLKLDLVKKLKINFERFVNLMTHVQAGYHPNPYHNATHAADVTHVVYYILSKGGLAEKCNLSSRDIFACILSAAIHDYDHPGFNNSFHIRTNAHLATLYNDRSILENHHLACVFEMLKHPSLNIFCDAGEEDRKAVRDTMCEMVLSTDMGRHQTIFDSFRTKLGETMNWASGDDAEAKQLALSMAIKMADVSNTCRPRNLYIPWVQMLTQEFYHQGDHELLLNTPISPFMDRTKHCDLSRGQISFINFVILPMFEATGQFLPSMRFTTDVAKANREYWQNSQVSPKTTTSTTN